jgi:hypothetical protein
VPVAFTRLDPSQWNSARTTDAIEWLNEEFRPRIKSQSVPPCAETVPMPLRVLPASGRIQMHKVDGGESSVKLSNRSPLNPWPDRAKIPMPGGRRPIDEDVMRNRDNSETSE